MLAPGEFDCCVQVVSLTTFEPEEAHAQLLAFRELEQAAQFRGTVLERFSDRVSLLAGPLVSRTTSANSSTKSEKSLRRFETILPPRQHSLRGLFRAEGSPYSTWQRRANLTVLGLVLLTAGLLINNESIRRHRMKRA